MALGARGNGIHPIFHVNVPSLPVPTIGVIELTFIRGVNSHKHVTETIVPSGTKYIDIQLVHLLDFCGLIWANRDHIPKIWTNLQSTKDWYKSSTELTKWFRIH